MIMHYRDSKNITREEFTAILGSGRSEEICVALVDATHSVSDRVWIEQICLHLLRHPNEEVRGTAVTCIGHLARIDKKLNIKSVTEALTSLYRVDDRLRGRIEDAADDIKVFMGEDVLVI